jgi:GT2 family glycosyltransferase/SAM-dependent methyltransferase
MPFSGERLTGAISGQVEIEHYHRYLLARDYCRDRDVLDVASGEGYGTALIAQVAKSVVGIEYDENTVLTARTSFQKPNLRFERGDARAMPLPDGCVDVVVSFETLEHLAEHEQFISEIRRVLRPDGLLIISTPDRDIYSSAGSPPNPFHILELTRPEFESLISRNFKNTEILLQRVLIGSAILGDDTTNAPICYERRNESIIERSNGLPRAPYMLAFASDGPISNVPHSLYVYRGDIDTDPQRIDEYRRSVALAQAQIDQLQAAKQASGDQLKAHEQMSRMQHVQINALGARSKAISLQVDKLRDEVVLKDDRIRNLTFQIEAKTRDQMQAEECAQASQRRLNEILASTSWKMTFPLRGVGRRAPTLAIYMRRVAKLAWWSVTLQLFNRIKARNRSKASFAQDTLMIKDFPQSEAVSEHNGKVDVKSRNDVSHQVEQISFPPCSEPVVTIIIPTFGQVDLTVQCLRSISENLPYVPIEVLVVDDAYVGPESLEPLANISGIRFLRNDKNLGFLLSCNEAARLARGKYIHFLNNDTTVTTGSIDALYEILEAHSDVGMVGSKLVFPDGTLQEAGAIIWSDASGWNYGRGKDPDLPEFNYLREVDYCSGASVLVRRDVFEKLGGFEEALAPAYYEDVDLAFRIRQLGLRVMYHPRSEIIHFEGKSHGTDLNVGIKAHQVINQKWIVDRWADVLNKNHFRPGTHVLRARDRARHKRVILVIDHYVPEPDRDAGSRSTMGILEVLTDAGWVVKFWPHNRAYHPLYTMNLECLGVEVIDSRWPGQLQEWIEINGGELDHIMVHRPHVADAIISQIVGKSNAVLSYYGHDLHFARMSREAVLNDDPQLLKQSEIMQQLEKRMWRCFDVVIYPSLEETLEVKKQISGKTVRPIVPFYVEPYPSRKNPASGNTILFVAGFAHPPNVDAAKFLVREIMPQLENAFGPVKIILAGSNPTDDVRKLASERTIVTGYVTDVELSKLYAQSRVAVVPLRFGAGVKGKVVEAIGHGLPLVTTSVGAQGIPHLEEAAAVHDEVGDIVVALKELLQDDGKWIAQSERQIKFASEYFSHSAMQTSVISALLAGEEALYGSAIKAGE